MVTACEGEPGPRTGTNAGWEGGGMPHFRKRQAQTNGRQLGENTKHTSRKLVLCIALVGWSILQLGESSCCTRRQLGENTKGSVFFYPTISLRISHAILDVQDVFFLLGLIGDTHSVNTVHLDMPMQEAYVSVNGQCYVNTKCSRADN